METPATLQSFCDRPLATTFDTAKRPSSFKQVLLHDWWLVRADSNSHGKQICIGGFTFREGRGAKRHFLSAPIVKRQDAVTLKTVDGIAVMVVGYLNKFKTLKNGFSHEVCDHFVIGFPYYWEEFTDLSVREERADFCGSKGILCSNSYKTTSPEDQGTDAFDSTPNEASSGKKETPQPMHSVVSRDHGTRIFDSTPSEALSGKKETPQPVDSVVSEDHGTGTFDSGPSEASSGKKETPQPMHNVVSGDHKPPNTKTKRKDSSNVKRVIHSGCWTRSSVRRITRSMQIK